MYYARTVFIAILFLSLAGTALAHATVSPKQVDTATYQNFTVNVPTEKVVPTTKVSLMIPSGLTNVTPFVKDGWKITQTKDAAGKVTDIEWSGGVIPVGLKQSFDFTARTPDESAELDWKVYQTYQDGEVVAWEQDPSTGKADNPYSITQVVPKDASPAGASRSDSLPLFVSGVALLLALIAVAKVYKKAA